jgi:outer membrane protein OmpA-like peptidoglycan-associated protein
MQPTAWLRVADAGEKPAWAAEATMNPDYKKESGVSTNGATETKDTTSAPASTGGAAPAWAAEATMNPDYKPGESAAAPAAAPAAAAEAPATQATTAEKPAWAADAKMNPDYKPGETAAAPATAPAASATDAVATCSRALSGEDSNKILFGAGSHAVAASSHAVLKKIAGIIKDCGSVTIEIDGYTDNVGGSEINKSLSERRAKSVADFLTSIGVDAGKLKAVGHGDENPIASNDTAEGRKMNRRIELKVSAQ